MLPARTCVVLRNTNGGGNCQTFRGVFFKFYINKRKMGAHSWAETAPREDTGPEGRTDISKYYCPLNF